VIISTNVPMSELKAGVSAFKSDLSSITKCDQNHICDNYAFGNKAGAQHELLFNEPASELTH
jgi:hypothetical protein